ncbi:MAG: coproporphyrinogen dehydrogenase HemZ [Clostridiales bacterium]|nr:coproporphyrinogen dehydrogenase HemZ [Clostridiales bacterium]
MSIDIRNNTELYDVARLFFGDDCPSITLDNFGDEFTVKINEASYRNIYTDERYNIIPRERRVGRLSKIALYDALNVFTGRVMPWGALTGVRPTKLFYECLRANKTIEQAENIMRNVYRVSAERANVLKRIICAQRGKVEFSPEFYNLYVHVPYCTTRCNYCSFVSAPIGKCAEQAKQYVDLLVDEISRSREKLSACGKKVLSVYIGGGTPTALDPKSFEKLLCALDGFDCEYTCEAGRPDTVTPEKIDIMKAHGVTRVCVNPQTLNDKTLALIGRNHGTDDFYRVYDEVKSHGFVINCDLIAGLDGETTNDFINSYEGVKKLAPHNLTVHSLSKKNGSAIRYRDGENADASQMLEYVLNNLGEYEPYYLYRQKRQAGNLENVGLFLQDFQCVNNITTMEETVGVMACGAGAISKFIAGGNIYRFANMRDVNLYISRYDEKIPAKLDYFSKVGL